MNMKKLGKKLKQLDMSFDRVNWGGCACVAAMVAKELRHEFPIMRITSSGTWGKCDLDSIRHHLDDNMCKDEWYHSGIHFNHVWVEVLSKGRWYVLDATGVYTRKEMYSMWGKPAEGSFSIDEIQALADTDSWNSMFNRKQLPAMQEMVSNMLPV